MNEGEAISIDKQMLENNILRFLYNKVKAYPCRSFVSKHECIPKIESNYLMSMHQKGGKERLI